MKRKPLHIVKQGGLWYCRGTLIMFGCDVPITAMGYTPSHALQEWILNAMKMNRA